MESKHLQKGTREELWEIPEGADPTVKEKAAQGKVLKDGAGLEKGTRCSLVCGSQPVPWHWGGSADGFGRLARWGVAAMEGFGKAAMGAKNMCSFLESSTHPFFPLVPAPKPSTLY